MKHRNSFFWALVAWCVVTLSKASRVDLSAAAIPAVMLARESVEGDRRESPAYLAATSIPECRSSTGALIER
jgi:hypothetical protein